ncbi:MAG: PEGA domain-containing protein [bacterium]
MPISKSTRNFLAYLLGTTIVLFGTILLGAMATGWQYNPSTGELNDTGLIIMSTEPSNAKISLNNKLLPSKTPYRAINVIPGEYTVQYDLENYRPWLKKTQVDAERVSFADYAWLIPNQIPSRLRYADQRIISSTQSVDRKRFAFVEQSAPTNPAIPVKLSISYAGDLSRPPINLYTPTEDTTNPITTLDSLSLNADSSWLLFRQIDTNKVVSWRLIPTNPNEQARQINLTETTKDQPSWIGWSDSEGNDLFYISNTNLRRLQVNERKLSDPVADGVITAKWTNNHLMTVEVLSDGLRWLRVRPKSNLSSPISITQVPTSDSYSLEYFRLFDHDYAAVLPSSTKQLSITRDIILNSDQRVTSISGKNVTAFTVNRSGRYIVQNENDTLYTIDLERNLRYRFKTPLAGLTSWQWMNDQHLAVVTQNQLRLMDYDGQNDQLISNTITPSSPILFWDNKSLLSFVTPGGNDANRSRLTHFFLTPDKILE